MIKSICVVYVDDNIQLQLSAYLQKLNDFQYDEMVFDANESYEQILDNDKIRHANIVIIDSRLFENCNVGEEKYTGEEIMIILNKIYPFIQVILISQNDDEDKLGIIPKYKSKPGDSISDSVAFYDRVLYPEIKKCVQKIGVISKIEEKLIESKHIDKYLIENVSNCIEGISAYDLLSKKDVDELIDSFKKMEFKINGL